MFRVRIAFHNGSWRSMSDAAIMIYELMARETHTEVWFDDVAFGACCNVCPSIRAWCVPSDVEYKAEEWSCVELPIADAKRALAILEDMLASPARYYISVCECAMPKCVVDAIERDADCMHPEDWRGVFCSQFALLFVRRCALEGILNVPQARQPLLWSVSSKACLPSRLRVILDRMLEK